MIVRQEYRGDQAPQTISGTPQNFSASWADLGGEIYMRDHNEITLFLTLDINDSQDCRLRLLAKHTSGGAEEYPIPLVSETGGPPANIRTIEDEGYWEWENDADQLTPVAVKIGDGIHWVQPQIMAGTVGATPGQIDAAYYVRSWSP